MSKIKILKFIFLFFLFTPYLAYAQGSVYLSPSSGSYKVGEIFSVLIKINSGGQAVNAGSANINFDNTKLEVESMGYSRSIFNIWTEEPSFSNSDGIVKFSGGVPSPGYTGNGAAVLRVTFRAKAVGSAPVVFSSGSLLANDGYGTNILDDLPGGLYQITAAVAKPKLPAPLAPEIKPEDGISAKEVSPPIITNYPSQIEENAILIINGLGYPNSTIVLYFQNNNDPVVTEDVLSGIDGRFSFTYSRKILAGALQVKAKNVLLDGASSGLSETVNIEVTRPFFLRIGSIAIEYMTVFLTLLAIIVLCLIAIGYLWLRLRKWQDKRGHKISEAEKALHHGFDKLKEGMTHYFNYIFNAKNIKELKRRERESAEKLEKDLNKVREELEDEIEGIRKGKK